LPEDDHDGRRHNDDNGEILQKRELIGKSKENRIHDGIRDVFVGGKRAGEKNIVGGGEKRGLGGCRARLKSGCLTAANSRKQPLKQGKYAQDQLETR